MDFHQLIARMQELDRPAVEAQSTTEECGMMPPVSPMSRPETPPIPHPSMSINLNAQGMDNIEQLMKLVTKVNPEMEKPSMPSMPTMAPPPSIMSIKPSLPPLKMLPDLDADNDDMPGGEKDMDLPKDIMVKMGDNQDDDKGSQPGGLGASLDRDGDGDHDMDDHDMEKDSESDDSEDNDKKEAWANEPEEEVKNIDYMVNKLAGGMNKPKDTFPKVSDGDNPMQRVREDADLRDQIKAELRKRLAEAKGAK
jgi:hypothetical protein